MEWMCAMLLRWQDPTASSRCAHAEYNSTPPPRQAIVSLELDFTRGVVTALGSRGLPPEWSPRDPDFIPEGPDDLSSMVLFLDLETGKGDSAHSKQKSAAARDRARARRA